ncbi:MAG TPA: Cof-type HAD-IIB family hydrolase [Solirubrobacteraceae bacterium]|nr:Cof-type HAD-IIB family hydrolase [Solirubrobacteraceae bacterium]
MLPRAIASDLDGTLLRSDGTLDERSRRTLAAIQRAGVLLVLCTARPPRWMRPLAQATGHGGVAVCANGAVTWDLHADAVLETRALAPPVAADVVRRLKQALPDASWAVETADRFGHEPDYLPHWPVPDGTIVDAVEALITQPATKLLLRHDYLPADALVTVARERIGDLAEPTHSNSEGSLLEITAAGVSKASALARLCAERGIDRTEVVAFGDMPNDLPMLEWAGHGVAVANAHLDVLAAADEITLANDDAGVAHVLERLLAGGTASAA